MADLKSYFQGVDLDSGGGTDYVLAVNLRLSASGGSIEALGQQLSAVSIPVVIASDQSAVVVNTELAAAAALTDDFANPTTAPVGAFNMVWDGSTWDRLPGTSAAGVLCNTELSAAAALADATANPTVTSVGGFMQGYNGTTWDRVRTANTGRLQVDVITGGGSDAPTTPASTYVTNSVNAGSTTSFDTADLGTAVLWQFEVWGSAAYKAALYTVANSVESTDPIVVGGGQAFDTFTWKAPHRSFVSLTTSGGSDLFRVKVSNLDDSNAASFYVSAHHSAS